MFIAIKKRKSRAGFFISRLVPSPTHLSMSFAFNHISVLPSFDAPSHANGNEILSILPSIAGDEQPFWQFASWDWRLERCNPLAASFPPLPNQIYRRAHFLLSWNGNSIRNAPSSHLLQGGFLNPRNDANKPLISHSASLIGCLNVDWVSSVVNYLVSCGNRKASCAHFRWSFLTALARRFSLRST